MRTDCPKKVVISHKKNIFVALYVESLKFIGLVTTRMFILRHFIGETVNDRNWNIVGSNLIFFRIDRNSFYISGLWDKKWILLNDYTSQKNKLIYKLSLPIWRKPKWLFDENRNDYSSAWTDKERSLYVRSWIWPLTVSWQRVTSTRLSCA